MHLDDGFHRMSVKHSRVLHVFNQLDPGGAELRTAELVKETGLVFDFLCIAGGHGHLDNDLRSDGHNVTNMRLSILSLAKFYHFIRDGNFRAVHSHLGSASGFILLMALLARIPRRITHFRSDGVGGQPRLVKTIYLFVSRLLVQICSTHILGVAPGSLQQGWKKNWQNDKRCRVIPNGYDAASLRRRAASEPATASSHVLQLVNVARPLPEKNRRRAIEIWLEASAIFSVDLILVGEVSDEERQLCEDAARKAPSASQLSLIGFTSKAVEEIGRGDVLLVTSWREGLPGVILEALALGVPVVSSDLPGSRWIAEHIEGILICKLSDDNASWIRAIESAQAFSSDDIRSSFDQSPFNQDKVLPEFLNVWGLDAPN